MECSIWPANRRQRTHGKLLLCPIKTSAEPCSQWRPSRLASQPIYMGISKVSDCVRFLSQSSGIRYSATLWEHGEGKRRQRRQQDPLQTGTRSSLSPVVEFSTRNSVAPPGEKTSRNVLVKLTELSCVDCEFLFDELPVTRCLLGYTVSLRVCLSHLRSKTFSRTGILRFARIGFEDLLVLHGENANRPPAARYAQKYTPLLITWPY